MTTLSLQELAREQQAQLRAEQAERLSDIPLDTRVRLALAPVWTVRLGSAAGLRDVETARFVFERLCEEGLMRRAPAPVGERDGNNADRYWVTPIARREVLREWDKGTDVSVVLAELSHLSHSFARTVKENLGPLPPLAERWAALAMRAGDGTAAVAQALDREVRARLNADDSGGALRWVEAALALDELLGGELSIAVARAGRRIELFHRRQDDKRALSLFLARPELLDAFDRLISGDDSLWALHYVGAGGVGKTMMMRYVSAELVPRLGGSSARIDFDYLNPDYPGKAPALLLAAVAEELALHDASGLAERLFARFDWKRSALDERLRDAPNAAAPVDAALGTSQFEDVLASFADAVERLPRPVVLLLDTCEELAKIRPDGTVPANVQATFEILERLHARLPWLRVVFGGRRSLASSGAGWTALGSRHAARPYLRLQEVKGFSRAEAERFLRERMVTREALVPAILARSSDAGDPERFSWESQSAAPAEERFSPFELRLYADWAAEDDTVTAEAILAADTHHYVEMRIVGRIANAEVSRLLPAVALLGRFDQETLRAVTSLTTEAFETVIEELAAQEWIQRQPEQFLEVDRGLRPKLLDYCRSRHPLDLERARTAAGRYLSSITLERELSALDVSHFEACLRLLSADLEAATAWWRAVEERFAREQAYDWARAMLYRIIDQAGTPGGPTPSEHALLEPLRASVLATYVSTLLHTSVTYDLDAWWAEVYTAAERHPLPDERDRLMVRGVAGRAAGAARAGRKVSADELSGLAAVAPEVDGDDQAAAAMIAALEAIVEREEIDASPRAQVLSLIGTTSQSITHGTVSRFLRGYAMSLGHRARALGGELDLEAFKPMQSLVQGGETLGQPWLDWQAPADIGSRVALEFVRSVAGAIDPGEIPVRQLPGPLAPSGPLNIDSERLASARLLALRAIRPLHDDEIQPLLVAASAFGVGAAEATCNAHRAYPPLLVACAEERARRGGAAEALDVLGASAHGSEQASASYAAVRDAELAAARIAVQMRLQDEGRRPSLVPDEPDAAELCWLVDGLDGRRAVKLAEPQAIAASVAGRADPQWLHVRWRTLYGLASEWAIASLRWVGGAGFGDGKPQTLAEHACRLDQLEANELARRWGQPPPFPMLDAKAVLKDARGAAELGSEDAWRIRVRSWALAGGRQGEQPGIALIGSRRLAEIELEEAQALALRLPGLARPMFADAADRFDTCTDEVGALLSRIGHALASVRVGDRDGIALGGSLETIARVARGPADVPFSPTASVEQSLSALDRIEQVEWRPWLARLVACLAWAGADEPMTPEVRAWLDVRYGTAALGSREVLLPAELDGILDEPVRLPRGRVLRRSTVRQRLNWALWVLAWVVVITYGVTVNPGGQSAGAIIGGFTLIFLLGMGLYLFGRDIMSWLVSRGGRVAMIRAENRSAQPVEPVVEAVIELNSRSGRELVKSTRTQIAVEAPYAEAAVELPEPLARGLQKVVKRARNRTARLDLEIDRDVAAVCWEAVLSHGTVAVGRPRDIPFRYRRVTDTVPLPGATRWRDLRRVVSFAPSPLDQTSSRAAWNRGLPKGCSAQVMPTSALRSGEHSTAVSGLVNAVRDVMAAARRAREGRLGSYASAQVVHIVTNAVVTASGVRLELEPPDPALKEIRDTARGDLVRADELPQIFPNAGFYVLQARPVPLPARTHAEREQAALLRAFAAELAGLGATAVVTVPPLAGVYAVNAIVQLAESLPGPLALRPIVRHGVPLRRRTPSPALTRAVARTRKKVLNRPEDLEAAFDLCVYVNAWEASRAASTGSAPRSTP